MLCMPVWVDRLDRIGNISGGISAVYKCGENTTPYDPPYGLWHTGIVAR